MTPPEVHHRYREQIGAFLLGKLDEGERTAMQAHLNSCSACQAEVRELKPVVTALADADPDRIDEAPWPPEDLEELTLAPILGEIHRARRRRRQFQWSALAAAAICVLAIGLAGFTWLLEPAVALVEPVPFSVAPGMEVEGNLIKHPWGTEIRIVVSGMRDGQTYRVTLVSEDGERVNAGTFIGTGDKPLRGTFNAALLRKEAAKLEVRTTGGELVFFANLPEEPVAVHDWPLFGILPWADQPPADTQNKPKADNSGGGTPHNGSSPESDGKRSSPGGEKPGSTPKESKPSGGLPEPPPYEPPAYEPPSPDQSPPDGQYGAQP
jgi:hypothetical protein